VAYFNRLNSDIQITTLATQFTTTPPRFHHKSTPQNAETPNKNAHSTMQKFFMQKRRIEAWELAEMKLWTALQATI
jgi:hypothetical protein